MTQKTETEKLFDDINSLYDEYASLLGQMNVESKIQTVREKILVSLYKVYVKIPKTAKEDENTIEDVNDNSYADEIVKISAGCLESFGKSPANGATFSQYACYSIKRRLNFLKHKDSTEQKNGGMKISEDAFKKAKKVKEFDELYKKLGSKDEKKRNRKIAEVLETTEEKVVELKALLKRETVSQFQTDENGETVDIIDKFTASSFVNPETLEAFREKYDSLFNAIKFVFKEKISEDKAAVFKKAFTVDLCRKHFPQRLADKYDGNDGQFNEERKIIDCYEDDEISGINKEKLFREAPFFDSAILDRLFSDEKYKLPEMQVLAAEVGYSDKSGLTQKLKRFYEKIAEKYEKDGFDRCFADMFLKP